MNKNMRHISAQTGDFNITYTQEASTDVKRRHIVVSSAESDEVLLTYTQEKATPKSETAFSTTGNAKKTGFLLCGAISLACATLVSLNGHNIAGAFLFALAFAVVVFAEAKLDSIPAPQYKYETEIVPATVFYKRHFYFEGSPAYVLEVEYNGVKGCVNNKYLFTNHEVRDTIDLKLTSKYDSDGNLISSSLHD